MHEHQGGKNGDDDAGNVEDRLFVGCRGDHGGLLCWRAECPLRHRFTGMTIAAKGPSRKA
jgi:hypothetical protein